MKGHTHTHIYIIYQTANGSEKVILVAGYYVFERLTANEINSILNLQFILCVCVYIYIYINERPRTLTYVYELR